MITEYLLNIALKAAREGGEHLKKRQNINIDSSDGRDIKLSSDKESEKIMIDILKDTKIPILSEESGNINESLHNDMIWIVDPLDGTVNYLKELDGLCCVSIALWKNGEPLLGVVNRFDCNEIYYGILGEGAFLNEEPVKPSDISNIDNAVLTCGFPVNMDYSEESLKSYIGNIQKFKKVRMLGAAALMCVFTAAGKADAYFEDNIMLWDIAGAVAIAKAAGCRISLEHLENNQCKIKCFANERLMEDFYK